MSDCRTIISEGEGLQALSVENPPRPLVFIPAAGIGSRVRDEALGLPKPLLSIANRPAMDWLLQQIPPDAEVVVGLGYRGALLREYLEFQYPERRWIFQTVDPFEGPGSGLGWTLLSCAQRL